jgi:hypothetical protein
VYKLAAMISRRLLAWLLILLAVGCRKKPPGDTAPPTGIAVVRRGADYVFQFAHCGNGEEAARVMDLDVYEMSEGDAGGASPSICSLVLTHDPRMSIAGEWRYGDVPAAYKKKRCDPLAPGRAYRMEVTHATFDFKLASNGDVAAISTACR